MISKMKKLTFLVYHKEYDTFLKSIRDAGVVHVEELDSGSVESPELEEKLLLAKRIEEAIARLNRYKLGDSEEIDSSVTGEVVLERLEKLEKELNKYKNEEQNISRLVETLTPWGSFNPDVSKQLSQANLVMNFYICGESNFNKEWIEEYNAVKISTQTARTHFVTITHPDQPLELNAEQIKLPPFELAEVRDSHAKLVTRIEGIEGEIQKIAQSQIPNLKAYLKDIQSNIEYSKVLLSTESSVENKLMILRGWIPANDSEQLVEELNQSNAYYEIDDPQPGDDVPIQLANKGFFAWFEPIAKLYMLPKYNEIDLTPYFAPFFMIFFGLCLGDSGYGVFLLLIATIYKLVAKNMSKTMRPIMSLVQLLGASTFFCGLLTGSFFGFDVYSIDYPFIVKLKSLAFFDNNQMFTLALVLGVIQVLFGMAMKVANQYVQFGIKHALEPLAWLVMLTYTFLLFGFPSLGAIGSTPHLVVCGISALFVFFYNSPDSNIFINFGLGFWNIYNMATGLLGDILSYVRLFALGLSGGILANVFNSLATGMSPDNMILGPIVMVIIFVLGHGINIFMNVLGAMVHPMRLTFVEFFNNAGFEGGGKEYNPFRKIN